MSNAIFPTLRGLGWPVSREPYFSTIVSTSASGQQVRLPNFPVPLERFELPINHLHGNSRVTPNLADFQTLYAFYVQRLGPYDSFLYLDPTDNYTVQNALYEGLPTISGLLPGQGQNFIPGIAGTFPAGDGTTKKFQLYANQGGAVRPIFDINGIKVTARPLGGGLYVGVPDNLGEAIMALLSGKLFGEPVITRLADPMPQAPTFKAPVPPKAPAPYRDGQMREEAIRQMKAQRETITQYRQRTGLSRTQLADTLNISRRSLGRWEQKGKKMSEV